MTRAAPMPVSTAPTYSAQAPAPRMKCCARTTTPAARMSSDPMRSMPGTNQDSTR